MSALPPPSRIPKVASLLLNKARLRVAFYGDSRAAASYSANGQRIHSWGLAHWLTVLTNGRAYCPPDLNFGVAGETSVQVAARVASVTASDADVVVLIASTNDTDTVASDSFNALAAAVRAIANSGKVVLWLTELPYNSVSSVSANRQAQLYRIRQQILRFAYRNVVAVDAWNLVIDPAATTAQWLAAYTYDGLHFSPAGAHRIASAIAPYINALVGANYPVLGISGDVYDATYNPSGNLVSTGSMKGSAGTKAGAGTITGTVPSNWNLTAAAAWAVTTSTIARTNANWFEMAITGTPTLGTDTVEFAQTVVIGNFAVGDIIEASCAIEVDAGGSNVYGPMLEMFANGGTNVLSGGYGDTTAKTGPGGTTPFGYAPTAAYSGIMRSPPFTVGTASSVKPRLVVKGDAGVAAAVTCRVGPFEFRKLAAAGVAL